MSDYRDKVKQKELTFLWRMAQEERDAPIKVIDSAITQVYNLLNSMGNSRYELMTYVASYNVIIANLAHITYSMADEPFQQVVDYV